MCVSRFCHSACLYDPLPMGANSLYCELKPLSGFNEPLPPPPPGQLLQHPIVCLWEGGGGARLGGQGLARVWMEGVHHEVVC